MQNKINIIIPPGRATTEEQKREVIERLYNAWIKNPELRLGQLITRQTSIDEMWLFYAEDFDLVERLEGK